MSGTNDNIEFKELNEGSAPVKTSDYTDFFEKMNTYTPETEEQKKTRQRKERKQRTWAAVSDGISAIANAWTVANGGGAVWTPKMSALARRDAKIKEAKDKREANRKEYYRQKLEAMKLDESSNIANYNRFAKDRDFSFNKLKRDDDNYKWGITFGYQKGRDAIKDEFERENLDIARKKANAAVANASAANAPKGVYRDKNGKLVFVATPELAVQLAKVAGTGGERKVTKTVTETNPYTGMPTTKTIETMEYDPMYNVDNKTYQ
jgi:hypothetical protein